VTDLTTRPYTGADAPHVAGLLNAIEAEADGGHRFSDAEIRALVLADVKDLGQDSRLVWTAAGTLAAAGVVTAPYPGGSRAGVEGGVHPRWRGRGIGRELLGWQFRRAAELHAQHDPAALWTVATGATVADDSARRLFERFGLHPVRYFLDMAAPTGGVHPVRVPDGIRIVRYAASLRAAVHQSHLEAFSDHWGHEPIGIDEWAGYTVSSEVFRGDLSLVALDGDQVAAYLLAYDGPDNHLYIGQVGTRQGWRKRGLATALVAQALAAAAADGKTTATLGVDADSPTGAVGVYERLGFTARHSPYAVYEKVLVS
jgi:mycothiol synthase